MSSQTTVAQAIVWVGYVIPVMAVFFLGGRRPATTAPTQADAETTATSLAQR
jgi:hypothetical protein